jgi:hypothetical protein
MMEIPCEKNQLVRRIAEVVSAPAITLAMDTASEARLGDRVREAIAADPQN